MLESLISKMPPKALEQMRDGISNPIPSDEYLKMRCKWANDVVGTLKGDDCKICKNRGYIVEIRGGNLVTVECGCMARRRSKRRIEKSGMEDLLRECTFESFWRQEEPWQVSMKRTAMDYVKHGYGKWFAACGSVGAGKTHICTAICGELINAGYDVRYMLWRDESVKIKASVNSAEDYERLIKPLKTVPVLYIDDLFKTKRGEKATDNITSADINLAFELINFRSFNENSITIISSEKTLGEIMDIDAGIGSRIFKRCGKGEYYIKLEGDKNQRLR